MREIVLDTETTGLNPDDGDRIVEIGAVEIEHLIPTGRTYHQYINPERSMPEEAFKVHGLGDEFLADKPVFASIVDAFVEFVGDVPLVIHNARFDMRFINAELKWAGRRLIPGDRAVDTLGMAQQRFPGQQNSLDALCRRFGVDGSRRVLHGALLDCELLAEVYLHLRGGRQTGLDLVASSVGAGRKGGAIADRPVRPARSFPASEAELAAHRAFVAKIKDPLWNT
ncbi:MAG: DNA polymerase III subunit epsilon [Geminicoccaceae bacterium]|nr:DNA polymerase III subunit epsilon [Geminicoccaceae bacterium]